MFGEQKGYLEISSPHLEVGIPSYWWGMYLTERERVREEDANQWALVFIQATPKIIEKEEKRQNVLLPMACFSLALLGSDDFPLGLS